MASLTQNTGQAVTNNSACLTPALRLYIFVTLQPAGVFSSQRLFIGNDLGLRLSFPGCPGQLYFFHIWHPAD